MAYRKHSFSLEKQKKIFFYSYINYINLPFFRLKTIYSMVSLDNKKKTKQVLIDNKNILINSQSTIFISRIFNLLFILKFIKFFNYLNKELEEEEEVEEEIKWRRKRNSLHYILFFLGFHTIKFFFKPLKQLINFSNNKKNSQKTSSLAIINKKNKQTSGYS
jgi:hypothetical protein